MYVNRDDHDLVPRIPLIMSEDEMLELSTVMPAGPQQAGDLRNDGSGSKNVLSHVIFRNLAFAIKTSNKDSAVKERRLVDGVSVAVGQGEVSC